MPKELGDLKKLKSITFDGCKNLEGTVFLPPGVSLSENAFRGCAKLERLECDFTKLRDIGDHALPKHLFEGCDKLDLGGTLKRHIIDNPDLEELDLSGYKHLKEVRRRDSG